MELPGLAVALAIEALAHRVGDAKRGRRCGLIGTDLVQPRHAGNGEAVAQSRPPLITRE